MDNKQLTSLMPVAALILGVLLPGSVLAKEPALEKEHEYMVVANYPNNIHVIDLQTDQLYKSCELPDAFGPGVTQIAPDGKTAYILNNHYEDIYGVNLDNCEVTFHASMSLQKGERTKSIFSFAISADGNELYAVQNPTMLYRDHYRVQPPRLAVYDTGAGLNAKPIRTFPSPRQVTVMQTGDDGTLYMAGADIYKVDVNTGKVDVAIPSRNWQRPLYAPPDVLNAWPIQSPSKDFTILYTTAKFQDESYNLETADWIYGFMNVNLETGETETTDFGPLTEIYFTGIRSPKDPNLVYGVLNRLAKYDIKKKELVQAAELDHSYYCIAINHDGSKIYLGGTFNDVAIYNADSMEKLGNIQLPGGDMAISTSQIFIR
ncbi:MAG: quinohemoprotein amine dehydrogenase subunit beta [Oceanospirillales bacterium]|uniref:Quinohemoprotein amine dehydrogenase beta subunit n=1 Tax=Marinobacterium halophilum TaxID=267374 RepID=A0A2P8EQF1_9GAMM|nr:quinohemoprotein amine dehydrogenase subunit beta [Marinobacterium halophilum]MBR9829743.1 quinohemoprotein amine dehydrogenase subunit beta [Oceanospirillales bacterium]PSL11699.1 quinohemoprotein amine dehydrogenase beta subunit [Marinobacterium halophilum]